MRDGHEPIGLLGLGAMGMPIAERLLSGGFAVVVFDVNEARMRLLGNKVTPAVSAADVANQCSIVIGCLPTLASYREAILGKGGVIEGKRVKRYVHFGTTGPGILRELSEPLRERAIQTVDAPVTGGVPRARKGELTVIVSGQKADANAIEGVLRSYGDKIVYVGEELGQAQTVKLINNMLSAGNLALACEALVLGKKAGIAPEQVLEVINSGTGQSDASLTKLPRYVVPRTFDYGGSLAITLKDTAAYMKEAASLGAPSDIAAAIRQSFLDASDNGHHDADMTAVALHFETLAGLEEAE